MIKKVPPEEALKILLCVNHLVAYPSKPELEG